MLGLLGLDAESIVGLAVGDADRAGQTVAGMAVPAAMVVPLRVVLTARASDGADASAALLRNPAAEPTTPASVGRWVRLATTDHLAPLMTHRLPRKSETALQQLRRLGIEYPA